MHRVTLQFQSTPSAWRETTFKEFICLDQHISIHSLRMEGDSELRHDGFIGKHFNPLPPHGGRHFLDCVPEHTKEFQSTPSAWRETQGIRHFRKRRSISIHSLRMEGDLINGKFTFEMYISIHSLRMEGDVQSLYYASDFLHFNPLPPHGGRHSETFTTFPVVGISIHSLRMEGDAYLISRRRCEVISIHSLRMEGDNQSLFNYILTLHFNPLPPHGGRRHRTIRNERCCYFNPLPPHGGRRLQNISDGRCVEISIHSLRMEGDGADSQSW